MARIRTVKPEFFRHEGLFAAESASGLPIRFAFMGLWGCCDREGRFKWRPQHLKLDIFPYDPTVDVAKILEVLEEYGFIQKYEHEGKYYGWVPSWSRHQKIDHHEMKSVLPDPSRCRQTKQNNLQPSTSLNSIAELLKTEMRIQCCFEPVLSFNKVAAASPTIPVVNESLVESAADMPAIEKVLSLSEAERVNSATPIESQAQVTRLSDLEAEFLSIVEKAAGSQPASVKNVEGTVLLNTVPDKFNECQSKPVGNENLSSLTHHDKIAPTLTKPISLKDNFSFAEANKRALGNGSPQSFSFVNDLSTVLNPSLRPSIFSAEELKKTEVLPLLNPIPGNAQQCPAMQRGNREYGIRNKE